MCIGVSGFLSIDDFAQAILAHSQVGYIIELCSGGIQNLIAEYALEKCS